MNRLAVLLRTPAVALVSKALADRFWPGASAVGQRMTVGTRLVEVIGVAADTRYRSVLDAPPPLPYRTFSETFAY